MKNVHTVTVSLNKDEWSKILDETFKKKNAETVIDGFRKGKAPKEVFIKKFGIEALYMDAVDAALPEAYTKALDENKLAPVCEPKVDIKGIDAEHLELEFTVITKPEVKVSSYKNLGVKKETPKVSKKEIEDEIINMQNRFAEIVVKESGTVEDGDIAVIDFEGFVEGVAFEGGKGTDYSLEIGSGTFIPGFEEQIIGVIVGETKDVNVKFPEEYVEDLKGKDATFKVTVKGIKTRVLPELNVEFFKDLGYENVKTKAELEKEVEEHLMMHVTEEAEDKYINELINAGIEKMTVEVNEEIIEEELNRMVRDFAQRLQMQGITVEQYFQFTNTTMEQFKETAKPDALNRIKSRYLLDEVITKEKLDAAEEEVLAHAEEQAAKYGCDKEELIQSYGGLEVVKYDLLVHKAIKVLES